MPHIGDDWTRSCRNPQHGSYTCSAPSLPPGAAPPFILTLFILMRHSPTYDNAVFLVEEILADRRTPFPLAAVPELPQLIAVALETPAKLACFCRVLALTVLEAEERGVVPDAVPGGDEFGDEQLSPSLAAMLRRDADGATTGITHANHALLLELPGFLERLLDMLRPPPRPASPVAPTEEDGVANMETDDGDGEFATGAVGGRPGMGTETVNEPPESTWLKEMQLCSQQVEFLFVLSTLLAGKHKVRAQDSLAKLGLINVLSEMFDAQGWGQPGANAAAADPRRPEGWGIHGPGCTCDPQASLRTQLLRVVHNFVDRDSDNIRNKRLLMTKRELASVGVVDGSGSAQAGAGGDGLLTKLLRVLLVEPPNSKYRFWLSSCVESFLRGAQPAHQTFVAQSGLLEMLTKEVSSSGRVRGAADATIGMSSSSSSDPENDGTSAKALQTSFDLLGETLKFNPYASTAPHTNAECYGPPPPLA